jgi:hypothetical protein
MNLGSPALGAYSLVLTSLNARAVYHRVRASKTRYKKSVADALISVQQTSLELTGDAHALEFIQENHQWREEIQQRLSRKGIWSLATATSVAWVVIAFALTLVDSFVSANSPLDNTAEGHAVGTVWLALLCLVIGWMWVPIFDSGELKTALDFANKQAEVAAKQLRKTKEMARKFIKFARNKPANKPAQGVENQGNPGDAVQEPGQNANLSANPNGGEGADGPTVPQDKTDPIAVTPAVPQDKTSPITVTPITPQDKTNPTAVGPTIAREKTDSTTGKPTVHQDKTDSMTDELFISKDLGSLNRDERRLSATFNYSRIMRYLVLVDDILGALDELAREVGLSKERLIKLVSLILNRGGSLPWAFPLWSRSRKSYSLEERSRRCSTRRLWQSFSSAERPLQPRSS